MEASADKAKNETKHREVKQEQTSTENGLPLSDQQMSDFEGMQRSECQGSQNSEGQRSQISEGQQRPEGHDFYGQEHDNYIFIKFRNGSENELKVHKGKQHFHQEQEPVASSSQAGASGSGSSPDSMWETESDETSPYLGSFPTDSVDVAEDDLDNIGIDMRIRRQLRDLYLEGDNDSFILQLLQDIDPEIDLSARWLKDNANEPLYPCNSKVKGTCAICIADDVDTRERLCCKVPVCETCVTEYLKNEVNQRNVQIQCINCESYVHRDEILALLPTEFKEKYYQFLVDENKDPNTKTCPRCCLIQNKNDILPTSSTTSSKKKKNKILGHKVLCAKCGLTWCFDCHAPWHESIKCKEFRKGDKLVKDWAKEFSYGQKNAIKCPKCKVFIQKRSGCNHMTCKNCNTNFCYRCGNRYVQMKLIGKHSDRFSPFGCKYNLLPNKPMARKAVRGSVLCAKIFGGVLLGGLIVAAAAIFIGGSIIIVPSYFGIKYYAWRDRQKVYRKYMLQREKLNMERASNDKTARNTQTMPELMLLDDGTYNNHSDTMTSTESSSSNDHHRSTEVKVWVHSEERDLDVKVNTQEQQTISSSHDNTVTTAEVTMEDDVVVLHVKTTNQTEQREVTNFEQEVDGSVKEKDKTGNTETNDENGNEVNVDTQGCFVKILGKLPVKWEKEEEKEGKLKENSLTGKPPIVKDKKRKLGTRRQRNQTDCISGSEYDNFDGLGPRQCNQVDGVSSSDQDHLDKSEKYSDLDNTLASEIQHMKNVCDVVDPYLGVVAVETCDTVF